MLSVYCYTITCLAARRAGVSSTAAESSTSCSAERAEMQRVAPGSSSKSERAEERSAPASPKLTKPPRRDRTCREENGILIDID